ncbi:hypothetical protein A0J61_11468 [Choanephora cucurbitarum]|uniref:Uncharacterized protein n=1 Tax=Choanephora cucurbitarum TaxID=101091 RepID=A0A1C7MUG6_9FUNG|nr:hypothetical protein A0J61_11468 [Choanephora cucurbitarum]
MPGTLHRYQTTGHDEDHSIGFMQFAMVHHKYPVILISIPELYRFVINDVYHNYASHLAH